MLLYSWLMIPNSRSEDLGVHLDKELLNSIGAALSDQFIPVNNIYNCFHLALAISRLLMLNTCRYRTAVVGREVLIGVRQPRYISMTLTSLTYPTVCSVTRKPETRLACEDGTSTLENLYCHCFWW